MVASQVHLVRHGEVFNPDGVLYGRLPGFGLSKLGIRMAAAAAEDLVGRDRPITGLIVSPLQRTRESSAPIAAAFELTATIDERIIEPTNHFEGMVMRRALRKPTNWPFLFNPWRPSWGEPYSSIAARMRAAVDDAFDSVDDGDVVLVSHQLPIWTAHLAIAGEGLPHSPTHRRCSLSSITSFTLAESDAPRESRIVQEVSYVEPASALLQAATDVGAV